MKRKKLITSGNTLIEVLVALGILSIFMSAIFTMKSANKSIKIKTNFAKERISIVKCLKEKVINEVSSEELMRNFQNKTVYASKEKIELKSLLKANIFEIFTDEKPSSYPYAELNIYKEGELINCKVTILNREDLKSQYSFYKGINR